MAVPIEVPEVGNGVLGIGEAASKLIGESASTVIGESEKDKRRREKRERREKRAAKELEVTHLMAEGSLVQDIYSEGAPGVSKKAKKDKKQKKDKKDKTTSVEVLTEDGLATQQTTTIDNSDIPCAGEAEDEAAAKERRRQEKKEKRANREKDRPRKRDERNSEVPFGELPIGGTEEEALISPAASPPSLEAFPLPTPAPAPDPQILARQGLPVGLTDATFVDQDLRVPAAELEYTFEGKVIKGVSERMAKRLAESGIEDFFAGQSYHICDLSNILMPCDSSSCDLAETASAQTHTACILKTT